MFPAGNLAAPDVTLSDVRARGPRTCGITAATGQVVCWGGLNFFGANTLTTAPVVPLAQLSVTISATCAIRATDRSIVCAGNPFVSPIPPATWSTIQTSIQATCALHASTGIMTCWGKSEPLLPPLSLRRTRWNTLAVGKQHVCAISASTNHTHCWGTVTESMPVTTLTSGIDFSCGLASGLPWCWGRAAPQPPLAAQPLSSLAAGYTSVCGITLIGTVVCTGIVTSNMAVNALALGVGQDHACVLTAPNRTAVCWGNNAYGQLTGVTVARNIRALSVGQYHACVILATGGLSCWGFNNGGAVMPAAAGTNFVQISAGASGSCALTNSGVLKCWGSNFFGKLTPAASALVQAPVMFTWGARAAACATGTYSLGDGAERALCGGGCAAGRFNLNGSVDASPVCQFPCPRGSYCSVDHPGPRPCPAGVFGAAEQLGSETCTNVCPIGFYCPAGTVAPLPCVAGRFGNRTAQTNSECTGPCLSGYWCPAGSVSASTNDCPADDATICGPGSTAPQVVPAGWYSIRNHTGMVVCEPGYVCAAGRKRACAAGQVWASTVLCIPCAAGSVSSSSAQLSCSPCAAGSFSVEGQTACSSCGAGLFANRSASTVCEPCAAGRFSEGGSITCTACHAGTYQPFVGAAFCVACAAGRAQLLPSRTSCYACAPGRFQSEDHGSSCDACSVGRYQPAASGTSCLQCDTETDGLNCAVHNCTAGWAWSIGSCRMCAPGAWSPGSAGARCARCATGTFALGNGSSTCTECSSLSTGAECLDGLVMSQRGFWLVPSTTSVLPCPVDLCIGESRCLQ